jgi:hypothetical protein
MVNSDLEFLVPAVSDSSSALLVCPALYSKALPHNLSTKHFLFFSSKMSATLQSTQRELPSNASEIFETTLEDKGGMVTETQSEELEVACQLSEYMSGPPLTLLMFSLCIVTFLVSLDRIIITVVSSRFSEYRSMLSTSTLSRSPKLQPTSSQQQTSAGMAQHTP